MISQVDRFLSLSFRKKWAHLPEVCGGIYIKKHILAPASRQVSLHIYKHPEEASTFHPSTKTSFSCLFLEVSLFLFFFLDIHVVRDNDVWGQLGHSGGGEITPTKCLFHLLGLLDQIGTGTRRGKAGADRSLCRNEPARLKESCPWNLLLQHKAECWNKGNLRLYCRQKEYANRNCRTHSILSLGNTCFFVFCFSFSTQ